APELLQHAGRAGLVPERPRAEAPGGPGHPGASQRLPRAVAASRTSLRSTGRDVAARRRARTLDATRDSVSGRRLGEDGVRSLKRTPRRGRPGIRVVPAGLTLGPCRPET